MTLTLRQQSVAAPAARDVRSTGPGMLTRSQQLGLVVVTAAFVAYVLVRLLA